MSDILQKVMMPTSMTGNEQQTEKVEYVNKMLSVTEKLVSALVVVTDTSNVTQIVLENLGKFTKNTETSQMFLL